MKEQLISKEMIRGLHPVFRKPYGDTLIKLVSKIAGVHKANDIYDGSKHLTGVDFINDLLDKQSITRIYKNIEILDSFRDQPFIITSNHPYGHIDGLIEIAGIAGVRKDYKVMVNWILMLIDTIEDHFIGVNPFPKDNKMSGAKSSVGGIKQCLEHLKDGHPLGLFPAGGISLPNIRGNVVDREWQEAPLKLIKKARVPVVPVHISGANSLTYQLLGYMGWQVRTTYLIHELANKKGKTITVSFGTPVSVDEQDKFKTTKELGEFLKSRTYQLKNTQ